MVLQRIWAVIIRHMYLQFRDMSRLLDITFWPVLDITLWGFAGFAMNSEAQGLIFNIALLPLVGAFLWQVVIRASLEFSVNVLEEQWAHNMANLFSSPITVFEWSLALMAIGAIRIAVLFSICSAFVWWMYGFSLAVFGWYIVPIVFSLLLSGWVLGCLTAVLIILWGRRLGVFAWAMAWMVAPFCGVFYPVQVLPPFMQKISTFLPMTYVFTSIRTYELTGLFPMDSLMMSIWMGIVYLGMALMLFKYMFEETRQFGIARLDND